MGRVPVRTAAVPTGRNLSRRGFLGLAAGAGLVLAGCRSAVDGGGGQARDLTLAVSSAPDPAMLLHRGTETPGFINLVFDRLVDLDPKTLRPTPWLAKEWEWSADGLTLVLKLRDDVTFHSGRKLAASDVVFTLQQAQLPEAQTQVLPILKRIKSVTASADHEVTITLSKPTSNLFDALMFNPVVDAETYAQAKQGEQVIGSGPYKWQKFTPGEQLELVANPDYWGGKPALEKITVRAIDNAQALLSALRANQVQLVGGVPGRDLKAIGSDKQYAVRGIESSYQQTYLGVDVLTKPFDDVRVRQALQYAVDRKRIVDQVYGGFGKVSSVPWLATTPGVTKDQVDRYPYDLDKAKSLLQQAGAQGATVSLFAANNPVFTSVLDIVQFNLTEAGLKVNVQALDAAEFGPRVREARLPGLFVANVGLVSVSPLTGISSAAPLRPNKNTSRFESAEFRKLETDAYAATTDEQVATVNKAITELLLQQSFHITLAQAYETYAWHTDVSGVETSFLGYLKLADAQRKGGTE